MPHVNLLLYSRYNEAIRLQREFTATDLNTIVQDVANAQESLLSYFRKMNNTFAARVGRDKSTCIVMAKFQRMTQNIKINASKRLILKINTYFCSVLTIC